MAEVFKLPERRGNLKEPERIVLEKLSKDWRRSGVVTDRYGRVFTVDEFGREKSDDK